MIQEKKLFSIIVMLVLLVGMFSITVFASGSGGDSDDGGDTEPPKEVETYMGYIQDTYTSTIWGDPVSNLLFAPGQSGSVTVSKSYTYQGGISGGHTFDAVNATISIDFSYSETTQTGVTVNVGPNPYTTGGEYGAGYYAKAYTRLVYTVQEGYTYPLYTDGTYSTSPSVRDYFTAKEFEGYSIKLKQTTSSYDPSL